MALWSARKAFFKLSFLFLFIGFVVFVVGFSTPFWYNTGHGGIQGLWQYCFDMCRRLEVEEAWFEVVRVLLCVELILYFAACVLALYDNCLATYDPLTFTITRRVEIATAAAGVMGGVGLAVYTVMMKLQHASGRAFHVTEFSGSYAATSISCTIALIVSAIMWVTNTVQPPDGTVLTGTCQGPGGQQTMVMTYQSTMPSAYPPYQHVPPNGSSPPYAPHAPPQPYPYPQSQPTAPPSYPGPPMAGQYEYHGSAGYGGKMHS